MMKERIIFLDIDGPMIPSYCYYMFGSGASYNRDMSPVSVVLLNNLCNKASAKIVCKSAHNYMTSLKNNDLKTDLILNGIEEKHFHPQWRTDFGLEIIESHARPLGRYESILKWLKENPDVEEWVDFDDENHTKDERLILVDFDYGIKMKEIEAAVELFCLPPTIIF